MGRYGDLSNRDDLFTMTPTVETLKGKPAEGRIGDGFS